MNFHIIELRVDAADQVIERIPWPLSYPTEEAARDAAKAAACDRGSAALSEEGNYWRIRTVDGGEFRFFAEEAPVLFNA